MRGFRTLAACHRASQRDLAPIPLITARVATLKPDAILFGTDEQYRAAMAAEYGDDWENMA